MDKPKPTIKQLVQYGVQFTHYKDGNLWYRVKVYDFAFPVPIADVGNATFLAEDKGILFMRYIRKQHALVEEASKA